MISGFLHALKNPENYEIACFIPRESASQKLRFPKINWIEATIDFQTFKPDVYLGIGGTPFQVKSGNWLLDSILGSLENADPKIPKYFIAVGAEEESKIQFEKIQRILHYVDHISTRDKATMDFLLKTWDAAQGKISLGGDLANICLNEIFPSPHKSSDRKYVIGVDYYSEIKEPNFTKVLKAFLKKVSKRDACIYFSNEVRSEFEEKFYREIVCSPIFRRPFNKVQFFRPNYLSKNIQDLVSHYLNYQVVLTSRYHALLTAAWAGCKVIALPRSSKVSNLAQELGIECLKYSCTQEELFHAFSKAKAVDSKVLVALKTRAKRCVNEFIANIG